MRIRRCLARRHKIGQPNVVTFAPKYCTTEATQKFVLIASIPGAGTIRAVVWSVRQKSEIQTAVCEVSLLTLVCSAAVEGRVQHLRVTAEELLRVSFLHKDPSLYVGTPESRHI